MSELPPYVLVVETAVDPAHDTEVTEWYEAVHLPELLTFPGIRSARRYMAENEGDRRYVTIVGLDSPDAVETEEFAGRQSLGGLAAYVTVTRRTVFGRTATER